MIRPARPGEADALTALCLRSKAYWGYPDDWMQAWERELWVTEDNIATGDVYVEEIDHRPVGVAFLEGDELGLLFVEPDHIRNGHGRRLLDHVVEVLRSRGTQRLLIESDPESEAFYLGMGAVRIGERRSREIDGRMLPLLELDTRRNPGPPERT